MHLIWHSRRGRRRNHLWQFFWWSVERCRFCGGSKIAFSYWQSQWPLTQGWRYRAACDRNDWHFSADVDSRVLQGSHRVLSSKLVPGKCGSTTHPHLGLTRSTLKRRFRQESQMVVPQGSAPGKRTSHSVYTPWPVPRRAQSVSSNWKPATGNAGLLAYSNFLILVQILFTVIPNTSLSVAYPERAGGTCFPDFRPGDSHAKVPPPPFHTRWCKSRF